VSRNEQPVQVDSLQAKSLLDGNAAVFVNKVIEAGAKEHESGSSASDGNTFGASSFDNEVRFQASPDKASFADATAGARASQVDEATSNGTAAPDPLRNILLQLKSEDNRRVDVRLIDRGGELHVSVKSVDPALAQQLQEHMPELTSRLSEQQFSHEVWVPKPAESAQSGASNMNGNAAGDNSSSASQNGDAGRRQNSKQQQGRPDWVDLLENQLG
jgi:hypothetical protein